MKILMDLMNSIKGVEFLNINIGFWLAMILIVLIVTLMNVILWNMKPKYTEK